MSKTKDLRSIDQTVIDESLTRQIAAIMLTNASVTECARTLAISPTSVKTIVASARYKEIVTETAENELGPALAKAKAQLARLTTKAVAAVERALDEGSSRDALNAATIVFKATGLHEDEKKEADTTLNIIMPGGAEPVTYEVIADDD
jgi:hypothetical protein